MMKTKLTGLAFGLALALGTMFSGSCSDKPKLPPIYDTQADGAKLIADALAIAQRGHKRVLVEFGANWCVWCHRLHTLLTTNPEIAPYFNAHFLLVLVDVNEVAGKPHNEEVIKRYGSPVQDGIPGLVLLEADGKPLKTQDVSEFEAGDHYDHAKVMKLLQAWTLKPVGN
jgi:thiol:disulfide interchange protein